MYGTASCFSRPTCQAYTMCVCCGNASRSSGELFKLLLTWYGIRSPYLHALQMCHLLPSLLLCTSFLKHCALWNAAPGNYVQVTVCSQEAPLRSL